MEATSAKRTVRHMQAARRHDEAAVRHAAGAVYWAHKGDEARAWQEARDARSERADAQVERKRAAVLTRNV